MNTKPFWEQAYRDLNGATFSGGKASREFHELVPLLSDGARVLDLGCGDGRNALFLAEHGWAALIETTTDGEKHTILLDAGLSETTLIHNMACLKIDPAPIEALVVSHGEVAKDVVLVLGRDLTPE